MNNNKPANLLTVNEKQLQENMSQSLSLFSASNKAADTLGRSGGFNFTSSAFPTLDEASKLSVSKKQSLSSLKTSPNTSPSGSGQSSKNNSPPASPTHESGAAETNTVKSAIVATVDETQKVEQKPLDTAEASVKNANAQVLDLGSNKKVEPLVRPGSQQQQQQQQPIKSQQQQQQQQVPTTNALQQGKRPKPRQQNQQFQQNRPFNSGKGKFNNRFSQTQSSSSSSQTNDNDQDLFPQSKSGSSHQGSGVSRTLVDEDQFEDTETEQPEEAFTHADSEVGSITSEQAEATKTKRQMNMVYITGQVNNEISVAAHSSFLEKSMNAFNKHLETDDKGKVAKIKCNPEKFANFLQKGRSWMSEDMFISGVVLDGTTKTDAKGVLTELTARREKPVVKTGNIKAQSDAISM